MADQTTVVVTEITMAVAENPATTKTLKNDTKPIYKITYCKSQPIKLLAFLILYNKL